MHHLTLRQLQVFNAVADKLSYTRAAETLFMSQPAVSMQVKQMEESIGLRLFEKLGKTIHLTEAGRELYQYVRTIFQELTEVEEILEAMKGVQSGRLRIAVASTVNYFAPRALAGFHRRYPNISLKLEATNRRGLMNMLERNEVDLVLMGQPPENLDLDAEPFMDNPLVVIAPPDHPLATARRIELTRLAEEPFLMRESGSGTRLAMERFFREHDIPIRMGMEMTRNEAIKQAVRAGLGLAVVSRHSLELELETRKLVELDVVGFPIHRTWFMVQRKGKRLSPSAQAFREYLLSGCQPETLEPKVAGSGP